MVQDHHFLVRLASAARQHAQARDGLTNQLRPYVELLVRRVLRQGPRSPLEDRISQVAHRVFGEQRADPAHSTELVNQVCHRLLSRMCGNAAAATARDTEACSPYELATMA